MQQGRILVAQHDGSYLLKLVGDVRLTLSGTIDEYLDQMFQSPEFRGVLVDLCEAEGLDSTTLGLLAKLALKVKGQCQYLPTVLSTNPNITRLIESMGFRQVFDLRTETPKEEADFAELPMVCCSEGECQERVIEAHRILMGLNEENRATFAELVATLERAKH